MEFPCCVNEFPIVKFSPMFSVPRRILSAGFRPGLPQGRSFLPLLFFAICFLWITGMNNLIMLLLHFQTSNCALLKTFSLSCMATRAYSYCSMLAIFSVSARKIQYDDWSVGMCNMPQRSIFRGRGHIMQRGVAGYAAYACQFSLFPSLHPPAFSSWPLNLRSSR